MKIRPTIINDSLQLLKSRIWENDLSQKFADGEAPLRSELFSTEQMEQHGKTLAGLHMPGPEVELQHSYRNGSEEYLKRFLKRFCFINIYSNIRCWNSTC
jgi:hypothetical protein